MKSSLRSNFIPLLLFFLLHFQTLLAQTNARVWSLEECITHALDHNLLIKQQILNNELNEEIYFQSRMNLLPNLNAFASHGYNWGQRVDLYTNDFATDRVRSNNFYASASLELFNGFQKMNTIKQNKLNIEAGKLDLDKFMDDISLTIATSYLQILYYQELLVIAQEQLEITNQQVERTRKLVEAGTLANGDLLTIQAQYATEELQAIDAENNLQISLLTLSQLLDLPTFEGFQVQKPEISIDVEAVKLQPAQQTYEYAVINQPDIKSAEIRLESSAKAIDIARGGYYPRLSLGSSWGSGYSGANKVGIDPFYNNIPLGVTQSGETVYRSVLDYGSYEIKPFSDQFDENKNQALDFSLSIPLFNGWIVRDAVAKAKIAYETSEIDLQVKKNDLRKIIQQSYVDAIASYKKHNSATKNVKAAQEAFKYAQQKFDVGIINSVLYNEAKKNLNKAQSELVQARYDFVFKTKVLDFYMGKPLTLKK